MSQYDSTHQVFYAPPTGEYIDDPIAVEAVSPRAITSSALRWAEKSRVVTRRDHSFTLPLMPAVLQDCHPQGSSVHTAGWRIECPTPPFSIQRLQIRALFLPTPPFAARASRPCFCSNADSRAHALQRRPSASSRGFPQSRHSLFALRLARFCFRFSF